jgi:hypothetical protein
VLLVANLASEGAGAGSRRAVARPERADQQGQSAPQRGREELPAGSVARQKPGQVVEALLGP